MAKLLKLRRGTTTQHGSFTGAEGEVTVDTDKETLVVHDGSTAGGHPVAAEDMANVSSASIAGRLATDSIAPAKIAAGTLPTDVTVASANIVDGTIVNADVNASAAVAGTKIAPNFGSQDVTTTGNFGAASVNITDTSPSLIFTDSAANSDFRIRAQSGVLKLRDDTNSADRLTIASNGTTTVAQNLDVGAGVDVTGNITVTGTVDGRDVAADGTKLDTYEANGSSYVRSDADDTASGQLTLTYSSTYPLNINSSDNGKIVLQGSTNPYIRFREGSTDKGYLQWNGNGYLDLQNNEDGSGIRIKDDIDFTMNSGTTYHKVWHAGNDGAGSGLDADTLDGVQGASYLRSDANDTVNGILSVASGKAVDFITGSWTGNTSGGTGKIQQHDSALYICGGDNGIRFREHGTDRWYIDGSGHFIPHSDSSYNIGENAKRVANGYFDTLYGDGSNLTGVQPFPSGTKMLFQQTSAPTGWTKITSSVDNKALRVVSGSVSSGGNQAFTSAFASRTPAGNVGSSGNSTASFSGSVSGNTGNSGASTSNVNTGGNVNNHTLSNNQMPSHSHSTSFRNHQNYGSNQGDGTRQGENANSTYNIGTNNSGGSGSHSHGFSGSGHSHNVNNHTHSFSANFSGNTGNHTHNAGSFSGTAMDFAVQYLDVIICSKD